MIQSPIAYWNCKVEFRCGRASEAEEVVSSQKSPIVKTFFGQMIKKRLLNGNILVSKKTNKHSDSQSNKQHADRSWDL